MSTEEIEETTTTKKQWGVNLWTNPAERAAVNALAKKNGLSIAKYLVKLARDDAHHSGMTWPEEA